MAVFGINLIAFICEIISWIKKRIKKYRVQEEKEREVDREKIVSSRKSRINK